MVFRPVYLTADEVLALHQLAIARYGGAPGLRAPAALESCLAQPMTAVFGYERFPTLAEKAAAYCYFIVRNHPFVDGNKRTGLLAAMHFLSSNGITPEFDEQIAYELICGAAAGVVELLELVPLFQTSPPS